MKRFVISPVARRDLREIWDYIGKENPTAADNLLESFHEKFEILVSMPEMGRQRDDVESGLRSFPVGRYLIFYNLLEDAIEIVRVLHGSRNLDLVFSEDN